MDRNDLEELWRGRVAEAKARFDAARRGTNAIVRDFPLDDTSPDGRHAYRTALRRENAALAEYNRVLRIYTAFIRDGVSPDEEE